MNTKSILKFLKLNESNISMILGALVIVILGFIVINYFRKESPGLIQTGTSTQNLPTEQPTIKRGEGPVQYTVSKGENLWSISVKQFGTGYNWVDIQTINKIVNPDRLLVGQKLTIPDVSPRIPIVKANENQNGSISSSTYKVVKGDSLWIIAKNTYGDAYKWTKIANANKLSNPNLIHPGNSLSIPR